ncbi:MAG: hypothetical protein ABRQ39_04025 [Candidatus Eremiobacterota bacterium]
MKIDYDISVETGQTFVVERFRPEDAKGVAHLFYAVYGSAYPFETYYIPERIIEENSNGNIYSVVARTPEGDIIGHGALYRSSPQNQNLYEIGQYIIRKNYRDTFAAFKINQYISEKLVKEVSPDGMFGEAVCNHIITQKSCSIIGMKDVAIELDLMPEETYKKEHNASGRVSCVISVKLFDDSCHEIFIPSVYKEKIDYILSDLNIQRIITCSSEEIPSGLSSDIGVKFFTFASVGRFNVITGGSDFDIITEELEHEGMKNNITIFQFFINLEKPWAGIIIEKLRKKGYFFGGYIPRWFNSDSILMQKNQKLPDFGNINLYSEKAKTLLSLIRSDWKNTVT